MPRLNPDKAHRTELIAFRLRPVEAEDLRELAESKDSTVSQLVRRLIRDAMEQEREAA